MHYMLPRRSQMKQKSMLEAKKSIGIMCVNLSQGSWWIQLLLVRIKRKDHIGEKDCEEEDGCTALYEGTHQY